MKTFQTFPTSHADFLHDVSFNYYGNRLATCSSDRKIKVWTRQTDDDDDGSNGGVVPVVMSLDPQDSPSDHPAQDDPAAASACGWQLQSEWTAHQGSVFKVTWAHPEYGQILASCSADRTVCIWEEHHTSSRSCWRNHAQLVDARESVHDLTFAPRHLGLRLATASADGYVRMYEATDIMNLGHWPLQEEFLAEKDGISCIAWNTSPFDVPMIVVGGHVVDQGPPPVIQKPPLSTSANNSHMSGSGSSSSSAAATIISIDHPSRRTASSSSVTSAAASASSSNHHHPSSSSSSSSSSGKHPMPGAKVWGYNSTYNRWQILAELCGHEQGIHDVAWANNMGRSYHLIATTSRDRTLRIWKLTLRESQFQYDVKQMAVLHHEDAEVWKVEWNVTGTMLSSSGDDGIVRLWKSDFDGNWICVSTIAGDMNKRQHQHASSSHNNMAQ